MRPISTRTIGSMRGSSLAALIEYIDADHVFLDRFTGDRLFDQVAKQTRTAFGPAELGAGEDTLQFGSQGFRRHDQHCINKKNEKRCYVTLSAVSCCYFHSSPYLEQNRFRWGLMRTKFLWLILFTALTGSTAVADGIVDLGVVDISTDSNASIQDLSDPSLVLTYTYQQQLFFGNLSMTFDSGQTLGQVLVTDEGPQFQDLVYNFPFVGGASGGYVQNTITTGISPGEFLSFTAESYSGTVYPGANNVGATINLDPTNPTAYVIDHPGRDVHGEFSSGRRAAHGNHRYAPHPSEAITIGSDVTTYIGEGRVFLLG